MIVYTFFIQDLYTTTEIDEPRGWKDLMNVLDRDFNVHGVFFKYTDGNLKLGFSCEARTLIEQAYQDDGTEAFYQFGVTEAANEFATPVTIFLGDVDFNTRNLEDDYFNAEINQIDNLVKLQTRSDLKTSFNKQLTHDGITVSKLNSQEITLLATKTFRQLRAQQTGIVISEQSDAVATSTVLRGQVGFDVLETIELAQFTNIDSIFQTDDVDDFLTLTRRSNLTFTLTADFDIDITEDQGSGTTDYVIGLTLLSSNRSKEGQNNFTFYAALPSGASPFNFSDTAYFSIGNGPLVFHGGEFEAGTSFRFQMFISMGTTGTAQFTADWTIRNFQIVFVDYAANVGSLAECYHPFDALNKTLNYITGEYDYLFSELLGDINRGYDINGCFSTMRMTNGYRVRQIQDDDKAPTESFSRFVGNLDAPGAIGYGVEELDSPTVLVNNTGQDRFTVEWNGIQGSRYDINILDVNLEAELTVGDIIGFFNGDEIFGTYEVASVNFNILPTRTDVELLINGRDVQIPVGAISEDVVIMTNATTEFRDRLRVEKWEHFYGDEELINLGDVEEYGEEPFDQALYNEFKLGFRQYGNDEDKPTTLEDFATRSSWGIPLVKTKNTLTRIMNWVMSTFMINESRNTLFSEKPTTSHKLDDNIFLFDVIDSVIDTTVTFTSGGGSVLDEIKVNANVYENYIRDSGFFSISNATLAANNQDYIYDTTTVEHIIPADTYTIQVIGLTGFVTSDVSDPATVTGYFHDGVEFVPSTKVEADENLISSSGISGPDYAYNQRRTQKRFLIRWGRFINSVLGYISDTARTIQNLDYLNNGALTTEIDTSLISEECLMGDSSASTIREDDNVNTNTFPEAKFKPNVIDFTVRICDDDWNLILDAHKNNAPYGQEGQNYGFFTIENPKGESKTGWLLNLKRNPVNRIGIVKILERNFLLIGAYNFSGIEKVTIADIPDFERTSTFYFKARFKNGSSDTISTLFNNILNLPKGVNIETMDAADSTPNSIRVSISQGVSNSIFVWSGAGEVSNLDFQDLEIWYDGSSTAAGVTVEVNGSPVSMNVINDNLSLSIQTGSSGFVVGRRKDELIANEGDFVLDSLEWTVDATKQFETDCTDNGDLICVDLSGQGNDGVIDLDTTNRNDFFI
ncbi:MAG: hypothetical protein V3W20_11680 [Candidatus Neomarinimicrobiota bacterium]